MKICEFCSKKNSPLYKLTPTLLCFFKPTRHFENLGKVFLPRKTIAQYTRISGFNATTVPWFFLKIILIYLKKKDILHCITFSKSVEFKAIIPYQIHFYQIFTVFKLIIIFNSFICHSFNISLIFDGKLGIRLLFNFFC